MNVTSIGKSLILFYAVDGLDSYTVQCCDAGGVYIKTYHGQLGSRSKLVTVRHSDEVLMLQENGCVWRIQRGSHHPTDITITHELTLWYGEIPLNGAVLYNDRLVIVGDFPLLTQVTEDLDLSLADIFSSVCKVQNLEAGTRGVSLAVLLKSLFNP